MPRQRAHQHRRQTRRDADYLRIWLRRFMPRPLKRRRVRGSRNFPQSSTRQPHRLIARKPRLQPSGNLGPVKLGLDRARARDLAGFSRPKGSFHERGSTYRISTSSFANTSGCCTSRRAGMSALGPRSGNGSASSSLGSSGPPL
jgi:hypothetical protein